MSLNYLQAFLTRFENNESVDQKDINEFFLNFGPVFLTKNFDTDLRITDDELKILNIFQKFGKHIYTRCADLAGECDRIELEIAKDRIKLKGLHETFQVYQKRKKELRLELNSMLAEKKET